MKTRTPKRLGMKRNLGHPVYLAKSVIESSRTLKVIPFDRRKAFARVS